MKQFFSSENDEQDQEVIRLLQNLAAFDSEYPPEFLARTRAAFVARVQQHSARTPAGHSSRKRLFHRLKEIRSVRAEYPPELLAARRAAFLEQVTQIEQLGATDATEELAPEDRQMIRLLGAIKSAEAGYPPEMLAARRSALLLQMEGLKKTTFFDRLRASIKGISQNRITVPTLQLPDFMRTSLVVASLLVAVLIASLLFGQRGQFLNPSPSQVPIGSAPVNSSHKTATLLCKPGDPAPPCPSPRLDPGQDLADQGNGLARPAVSKDALASSGGVHKAAYVNDGRSGASWVSRSADSWIKIDLGKVTTFNSVSLQKGSTGPSPDDHLGQFVIAVASSDVYSDGNSSNDYTEYAQVFNSAQTGFSGTVSNTQTVSALFPPVKARYVKITFAQAGAAIDEVGVFMVQPPAPTDQPTKKPKEDLTETTATPAPTSTLASTETATALSSDTPLVSPTDTLLPSPTGTLLPSDTPTPLPTNTLPPTDTSTPLPTNTLPPTDTPTPVPTMPLPSDTPIPTFTVVPPTAIPPTVQQPSASTDPIIITGNDQTLTFTCNDNSVVLRGHANTILLFGSCSSITVTGNGNHVYWQFGSPVITNNGTDNIVSQM